MVRDQKGAFSVEIEGDAMSWPPSSRLQRIGDMSLSLLIEMPCPDASRLIEAIGPDNGEFVEARAVDGSLVLSMQADTPLALLHTVEDLMSCLQIAVDTEAL